MKPRGVTEIPGVIRRRADRRFLGVKPPTIRGRVILYSQPRCGSTTFGRLLDAHPELLMAHEPFNPDSPFNSYAGAVTSHRELRRAVQNIWRHFSGIKHVSWKAWPFQRSPYLNDYLLRHAADRVVFLTRRNVLRQTVSNLIAVQSGVWSAQARDAGHGESIDALDPRIIADWLNASPSRRDFDRSILIESGRPFVEVAYEDLFGDEVSSHGRFEVLDEVLGFLGLSVDDPGVDHEALTANLDPDLSRLNSTETYRRIPGIDEIEARFGNDETGWLFR